MLKSHWMWNKIEKKKYKDDVKTISTVVYDLI